MNISRDAEKAFENSASLHDKHLGDVRNSSPYLNIVKAIFSKPVANIKLNREKLERIPLKLSTKQGCQLSPYLFNIVLKGLARKFRQQK